IVCQVSASNQDCLVYKDLFGNWQLRLDEDKDGAGFHSSSQKQMGCGLYFPDVPIPPGSKIEIAFLIFRSSTTHTLEGCKTGIFVEENATPLPFSTLDDYQARTRSLIIQWWPFVYTPWAKDVLYASPAIKSSIQKVIDLPGWAENNPIVCFWDDHDGRSSTAAFAEREAYSYNSKPEEAPRLEITFTPPDPPAPPPPANLPTPPPPPRKGWGGLDLQYEYLDDGWKLTLHTDVPCHLWCRMTTTPPRKHSMPSMRRGLRISGDIRFCFVVYEDNEQEEPGDTLIHTWLKDNWPYCETRWFYFIGTIYSDPSPSETAIYKFHFPAPPPEPPPPMYRTFYAEENNRTISKGAVTWPPAHDAPTGTILGNYFDPYFALFAGSYFSAGRHWIYRSFLSFDTTSMPATAKILTAELSPYVFNRQGVSALFPIYATEGLQHDPVIPADYGDQLPITTPAGSSPVPGTGYQPIPLNAHGLSLIKPGEISRFCLRGHVDLLDTNPVAVYNNFIYYYSEQKGAGFQPKLAISYYPA
ncbi:unnamed protein product, partial [marine sediment metagenome]